MRPIRPKLRTVLLAGLALLLWGCGRGGDREPQRDEHGILQPAYFIQHAQDGREWKLLSIRPKENSISRERILKTDRPGHWREMQTHYYTVKKEAPINVFRAYYSRFKKICPDLTLITLEDNGNNLLCAWQHTGTPTFPGQYEIRRIFRGPDGTYIFSYTVNRAYYSENNFTVWMRILREAELRACSE
jgi:hypothetical protein